MVEADNRLPKAKAGESFFGKLGHSKATMYTGNLESHVHTQGKTYSQKTTENTPSFHLGLITWHSASLAN